MITETSVTIYPRILNDILLTNSNTITQPELIQNSRYHMRYYNWTCVILLIVIFILCITLVIYSTIRYT
jgi:hypothetical protein